MEKIMLGFLNEYYNKWFEFWILIAFVVFLVIAITVVIIWCKKIKLNFYKVKLSDFIKVSLIMEAISLLSRSLLNTSIIKNTFISIFNYGIELTIIVSILICISDKILFYKNESKISLVNRFLDFTIYIMYFFMVVSGYFGVKYFLNLFLWQFNFISVKFFINNTIVGKPRQLVKLILVTIKDLFKKESGVLKCGIDGQEKACPNNEDDLYPSRKKQLENLVKIIENAETNEDVVIAIKGQWGYGKSKLLEKLVNEYKEENYYIYIKPMMIDNREILLNEFKMKLKNIMSENGIYSGANSSLEKYFKAVMQLFQLNNKISLNELINISDPDITYRQLKDNIQKDIKLLLNSKKKDEEKKYKKKYKKKLVIIIDDFDRIEEKIQMDILAFMNDIVDFKGCIGILALDYENISKMEEQKKNKLITINYLEKFISDSIELSHVGFKELIEFHNKFIFKDFESNSKYVNEVFKKIKDNICNYYDEFEDIIEKNIDLDNKKINKLGENDEDKQKLQDKLKHKNDFKNSICKMIDNSRKVKYFLNAIEGNVELLKNYKEDNFTDEIFKKIDVGKVVYLMCFIKIFYKEIYEKIINFNGIKEFLYYYEDIKKDDGNEKYDDKDYVVELIKHIIPNCAKDSKVKYNAFDRLQYKLNEDEKVRLNLYYDFVKDIYINFKFLGSKFNLLTDSESMVKEVDDNKINFGEENYIQKINIYLDAIYNGNVEIIEIRLNKLLDYIIKDLVKKNKISVLDFCEIASNRTFYNLNYCKNYLCEINTYFINNNIKISKIEKIKINKCLNEILIKSIKDYTNYFESIKLVDFIPDHCKEKFNKQVEILNSICDGFDYTKDLDIDAIKSITNSIKTVDEIVKYICNNIQKNKFMSTRKYFIDILKNTTNEFVKINKLIEKTRKILLDKNLDSKYEEFSNEVYNNDVPGIELDIEQLSKQDKFDWYKYEYFEKIIIYIVNNKCEAEINDNTKKNIEAIWNNYVDLKYGDNNKSFLELTIKCDKILNSN